MAFRSGNSASEFSKSLRKTPSALSRMPWKPATVTSTPPPRAGTRLASAPPFPCRGSRARKFSSPPSSATASRARPSRHSATAASRDEPRSRQRLCRLTSSGSGHRYIGHVSGPESLSPAQSQRIGLPVPAVEPGEFSEKGGYDATLRLVRAHPEVTAVYTSTLNQAIGTLHALHELGLAVPEQISVISYDDFPLADYSNPH